MKKISDNLEDDDLAAEIPLLKKGVHDSPHIMLGDTRYIYCRYSMSTNRILIAILGYGCNRSMRTNQTEPGINYHIVHRKKFH